MRSLRLARWLQRISYLANKAAYRAVGESQQDSVSRLDEYVRGCPVPQNAIDLLPGWSGALPPCVPVQAGPAAFYNDPRIIWALEQFGSAADRRILELGPLEAGHTYMIEQREPEFIHAIEANKTAYMRCLVVKELLDLRRAKFFLGDFSDWLRETDIRYDFVLACGVLYHMQNPFELLELISKRSDAVYFWTHYFDETAMPLGDSRRVPFLGNSKKIDFHGIQVSLYERSYFSAWQSKSFCGGIYDLHNWTTKVDILAALGAVGFRDIRVAHDDVTHSNGPSISIFARK